MEHLSHNSRVLQSLRPGDRVQFHRVLYSHWGIYIGGGKIIHVAGDKGGKVEIRIDNFWDVVRDDKASKNNGKDVEWRSLPVEDIIERALSRLGETVDYTLLRENCEHFVNWCRYGRMKSDQADNFLTGVAIVSIGALTIGLVGAAIAAATANDDEKKQNKKKKVKSNQLLW